MCVELIVFQVALYKGRRIMPFGLPPATLYNFFTICVSVFCVFAWRYLSWRLYGLAFNSFKVKTWGVFEAAP